MHAISLIFIFFFPYHGEALEQLKIDMIDLHEKKKRKYNSQEPEI